MTCPSCKDGHKCMNCDLKDRGFMQKEDVEKTISEHMQKIKQDGNTGADKASVGGTAGLSIADVMAHFDDPTCAGGNCPIHRKKMQLLDEGAAQGLEAGLKLGGLGSE